MDDRRVGLAIRALRRRRRWRQIDLAAAARVSQPLISMIERGHLDGITLQTLRSVPSEYLAARRLGSLIHQPR